MAEYIEREAALEITKRTSGDYATAFAEIRKIPSVDVVSVVRCKDCEWFMHENGCPIEASGYHSRGRMLPDENDFCSYGERMDGGAENEI